jgi:acyl-homoserine lactone acylase PvdQ
MLRSTSLAAVAAFLIMAAPAAAKDYAPDALNIIPSGQYGGFPVPAGADQQALMYDGLTPLFDQVTAPDLTKYFKSEALGAAGSPAPTHVEATPRNGLKIVRDAFNVPHITGKTRDDVTWGAGWVLEEDRALLLTQGRYPARMAALDAPGINAFGLVTGLKQVTVTKQADKIIDTAQTGALKHAGKEGRALLHDIDVYVKGINARLKFEKSSQKPWTRVDVYSINALAGQIFGQGGGDEVRRSQLLDGLRKRLGKSQADTIFNDLSEHLDKDTPTTISKPFPYEQVPNTQSGNALIDNGSTSPKTNTAVATAAKNHRYASNFLMVSAKRSATGHPLFVAGPQIGYFYPGLTLEMDLKGPGIEARGAAMPGGPGDILIGRGQDHAWSLTSAGSDTNDQFVETLCGGSDTKYMYKGKCLKMGRVDAGNIAGQGEVVFSTTVHGPVQGYATSGGKRVAITFKRSSYGKDILWQIMFKRLSTNQVSGLKTFYSAAATSPFTFNVAYADDKNIATYSAGLLPLRDKRVDPRLPTKGTGKYEWKGFLSANGHPHEANPASGKLVNWNNKPAPGFGSSDSEWSYGSIHRVQMLNAGIDARQTHDLASVTSAMNRAATTDLRDFGTVLDGITAVLDSPGPAPSARALQMEQYLKDWRALGSNRLDKDLDGSIDAGPAPAIMGFVYSKVADAVLGPVLGPQLQQLSDLEGANNSSGSGFTGGRIYYVDKDLRQLTGTQFKTPFTTRFCGSGDLAACRASLWAAFEQAGTELAAAQGSENPADWKFDANSERIHFAPGLLSTTIRYTNRPSGIQQVLSFSGHRKTRK